MKIIGYVSGYNSNDRRCVQHVDFVNVGRTVYEGEYLSCTYCLDAWKPFVGMTADERVCAERAAKGERHCDNCLTFQPMFTGDLCDLCVIERPMTEPYRSRPNMDVLNDTRVYPIELIAARLEALAAEREYMRAFVSPAPRAVWMGAERYRAAAERVFDVECSAYAAR